MVKVVLFLSNAGDNVNLALSDRHNKLLPCTVERRNLTTMISFDIEMPNLLTLELSNKNVNLPIAVELIGVELGLIKVNRNRLLELCQFYPKNSSNSYFTTLWNSEGKVQFDIFDLDPIRFHLHWESTI